MTGRQLELPHLWKPRAYQEPLWRYMHGGGKRAIAIWPRRHGKDDLALHYTACAAHERVGVYWHLLPQQNQARKAIWDAVNPHTGRRRIDDAFPKELRETTREQDMLIRFKTGSTWQVIGSDNYDALVGTPPIGVVFSEWALSSPQAWSLIRPILLENGGWSIFITTPRGRNHAHRMYQMAKDSGDWFAEHLTSDETGVFTPEQLSGEKAELVAERGEADGKRSTIRSTCALGRPLCRAPTTLVWWTSWRRTGGLAAFLTTPASRSTRPGTSGPTTRPWCGSSSERRWAGRSSTTWPTPRRALTGTSAKSSPSPTPTASTCCHTTATTSGLRCLRRRALRDTARTLGLKNVRVVPRTKSVANDINEVRKIIPLCVFDAEKCAHGIDALRSYRRVWDEKLKAYRDHPLHDWASDPADAFRTFAVGKPRDVDTRAWDEEEWRDDGGRSAVSGY
jgi:phage terminase large subunit